MNSPITAFRIYNKNFINSSVITEDDFFDYVWSEMSNDNIIMSGKIYYDGNIVLKVIDSSITVNFDEITLKSK